MKTTHRFLSNQWVLLFLGALTNAIIVAAPIMGISVLLPEISKDLGSSIVQAGFVWEIGALPSIFSSLIAGTIIDCFSTQYPVGFWSASCLIGSIFVAAIQVNPCLETKVNNSGIS